MENLKNKIISGFVWKFCERFLSQIVSFIVSLIVARILLPSDYGMVSMVNVFIIIANVFVINGFTAALIQKDETDNLDFSTIFFCSLFISILLYILLYIFAPLISKFYKVAELTNIIRVFGLILPISSYNAIQNAYVSKKMQFRKTFLGTFLGTVISGFVGIILAKKGFGVWALIYQYLINNIINCILLFVIIGWSPSLKFSFSRAKPMLKFGVNVFAADFIGTMFNQLNTFIIGKSFSLENLAYYNRGQSFPYLINGNIGSVLTNVMYPAFSNENNHEESFLKLAKKSVKLSTYILSPIYLGLAAAGYTMIKILLTDKWLECYPFMVIVCISCLFSGVSALDLQILKAKGFSNLVFKLEFIKKPIWLVATILAMFTNIYILTLVLVFIGFEEMIVNSFAVQKVICYKVKDKLCDFMYAIFPSIVMFLFVALLNLVKINSYILFPIQIVVGVLVFIGFSYVTKNDCLMDLLSMIRGRINEKQNGR